MRSRGGRTWRRSAWALLALAVGGCASTGQGPVADDLYADYVWPPPPDTPRIRLERVIAGRADVEATSRLARTLLGSVPATPYDRLSKPFAVAFDGRGRLLVTDSGTGALIRFDEAEGRMDVFGTRGSVRLKLPLGLTVDADGRVLVADAGLKRVVAFDEEGKVVAVYGRGGELDNPTDAVTSPDGERLLVADSKAHRLVVFDRTSGELLETIGQAGEAEGQFAFPTSLAFAPDGTLLVVDQINARVQVLTADGQYLTEFGSLGVGFGNFVRPKDVAVDELGLVYVTDNAFNNVQLFGPDYRLLTFVGEGGYGPGRFRGASGVAVEGDRFAVVDQLGRRVQVFRFLVAKDAP